MLENPKKIGFHTKENKSQQIIQLVLVTLL